MKREIFIALAAVALVAPSAMAGTYPTNKFDARYEVAGPSGKSEMRMASDGAGQFLTQTEAAGQKYVTLVDYKKNTSTTLINQGKMAMQSKLPADSGYVADENSVKKQGGKLIGSKSVAGHPCKGYQYTTPGGKTEVWIGDDVKIMVQSSTATQGGTVKMTLKSVAGAPPADAFKVPAGYKLMVQ